VGDEPVLFIDGVHPTQATKISYGWIRKGQKKAVKTTGSRTRLNVMGALNLKALASPLICEYKTINEYNVSRFFNEIRKVYPDYNQKIHVILDGAGYQGVLEILCHSSNIQSKRNDTCPSPSILTKRLRPSSPVRHSPAKMASNDHFQVFTPAS
jgi:hypothetical protein